MFCSAEMRTRMTNRATSSFLAYRAIGCLCTIVSLIRAACDRLRALIVSPISSSWLLGHSCFALINGAAGNSRNPRANRGLTRIVCRGKA
jgi:hypothetical protein